MKTQPCDIASLRLEDLPDHWSPWVKRNMARLYKAESVNFDFIPETAPHWVFSMLTEVVKTSIPSVDLKTLDQPGEAVLGAVAGHFRQILESPNGLPKQLENLGSILEKLDASLREKLGQKKYERHLHRHRRIIEDTERFFNNQAVCYKNKYKALIKCFTQAFLLPFDRQKIFFESYAQAIGTELHDHDGQSLRRTTSTPLYVWMLIYWRYVNRMPSVTVLYQWLCWAFGSQQIGDIARVKQMCFRHKVRLRPQGRPKTKK